MKIRETITYALFSSVLGPVLIAQSAHGICAILMNDQPADLVIELQACFPNATLHKDNEGFEKHAAKILAYVEKPVSKLDVKLDIRGTVFQKHVWAELQKIPIGKTVSYSDIARKLKKPKAFRAVARACAANALAVIIPCHRVVKSDGSISGYRWGVERKRQLITIEAA